MAKAGPSHGRCCARRWRSTRSTRTREFIDGRQGAMYRRPEGAPVVALAKGKVEFADFRGNEGLVLELRGDDGTLVRYAHLARLRREYRVGDEVAQGELVGLVGHTGLARNHRLRMELVDAAGKLVDPSLLTGSSRSIVTRVGEPLPESAKANFLGDVDAWRNAMKKAARTGE
jgi:murein DD-endopeptidase MepM/ murein hydrolase activator NlpD